LVPKVSVTGGYYRRKFDNLRVNDNLNLAPSDWNSFAIVAPKDARFPTGGGETITMYSVNDNKLGSATDTLVTFSTSNNNIYNGFEVSTNARFGKGFMFAGWTIERTETLSCDVRDNPNSFRFCGNVPPFRSLLKGSAAYTLPFDIQLSGSFSAKPGPSVNANYTVTSAIAGRTIFGSVTRTPTISVNLIEPNTLFLDYQKQLDARLAKNVRWGRFRVQGFVDFFNVLNAGTVTTVNTTYAATGTNAWFNPTAILTGRTIRFGTQMDF
jgi:hypothetical protein